MYAQPIETSRAVEAKIIRDRPGRRGPREWRDAVREVLADAEAQEEAQVKLVYEALLKYREDMRAVLQRTPPDRFTALHARAIQDELDRAAVRLRARLVELTERSVRSAASAGRDLIAKPLTAVGRLGVPGLIPTPIDTKALGLALRTSGDLIRGVTSTLARQVRAEVARAIAGGASPWDAMQRIGGDLARSGIPTPSVFSSTFQRAETIFRTETIGALNRSHNDTVARLAKRVPGLFAKMWLAVGDHRTRPEHLALWRETEAKPIPAGGKFRLTVTGGKDAGIYDVDGPHDPVLPASQVVNCRCLSVVVPAQKE